MGQTSAKFFPASTPYGQNPQTNVVQPQGPVAQAPQQQIPASTAYGNMGYPVQAQPLLPNTPMPAAVGAGGGRNMNPSKNATQFYGY